ncbi:tail terminator [Gordonia phage Ohgeesy]|uniref:Tail terminator n=1 Tax=Gordonia phage Ohgeesy TaxID=2762412 RepID=A0A7G8LG68_9CAUD|nr:tail terminator [Gordonia phage Ohgeesy]QNJ56240.1 tail terminator [Gordonia phage Ohgeesy]
MSVDPADLVSSLAQRLDDLEFGFYRPSGPYPTDLDRPAVTLGKLPQNITSAVAINHYLTDPDVFTVEHNPLHLVQLVFREPGPDPRPVLRSERRAFRLLHTLTSGSWPGGVSPLSVTFSHAAPADPDDDGNWTKAANYHIRLNPGD